MLETVLRPSLNLSVATVIDFFKQPDDSMAERLPGHGVMTLVDREIAARTTRSVINPD
jgi:hypothetical protein